MASNLLSIGRSEKQRVEQNRGPIAIAKYPVPEGAIAARGLGFFRVQVGRRSEPCAVNPLTREGAADGHETTDGRNFCIT